MSTTTLKKHVLCYYGSNYPKQCGTLIIDYGLQMQRGVTSLDIATNTRWFVTQLVPNCRDELPIDCSSHYAPACQLVRINIISLACRWKIILKCMIQIGLYSENFDQNIIVICIKTPVVDKNLVPTPIAARLIYKVTTWTMHIIVSIFRYPNICL